MPLWPLHRARPFPGARASPCRGRKDSPQLTAIQAKYVFRRPSPCRCSLIGRYGLGEADEEEVRIGACDSLRRGDAFGGWDDSRQCTSGRFRCCWWTPLLDELRELQDGLWRIPMSPGDRQVQALQPHAPQPWAQVDGRVAQLPLRTRKVPWRCQCGQAWDCRKANRPKDRW